MEAFLAIGLSKIPAERYASGAELAACFQAALAGNLPAEMRDRAARILERSPWADT